MKNVSKLLALVVVLCLALSVSALAAEPTWEDYQNYLVEAAGGNAPDLDEFKGQVSAIGSWDEMPLDESPWDMLFSTLGISTWDEFVAADGVGKQSLEVGSMGGGAASGEPSGEAVVPGSYTDGELTLVIADDMTFTMDKTGQNMEGEDFVLTVTGTVTEDGVFTITGLFDGDINLAEVASADQLAADLASVEAVYAAATGASAEPSGEPSGEPSPEPAK